jgi:Met-zincin/Domain of unknown function (DUF5117)/Domain of unknown function (DUF5118)
MPQSACTMTPTVSFPRAVRRLASAVMCVALPAGWMAGCASLPGVPASAAASAATAASAASGARAPAAASGAASAAALAAASGLRPFADVVKDAKQVEGFFNVWRKDDKVWLELKPSDLNKPFFLSPKIKTGIGEARLFGGTMASDAVVEFRRIHNQVQLLASNTEFIARAGTPNARAVEAAFSPSLLASTAVLSQPHPDRKSVLVEANALFLTDMLGIGLQLQREYRQGYAFDARNSAITTVRATPTLVVFETLSHFASASIAVPQPGAPPGAPVPGTPRSLPDPRSMFMTLHYSLAPLPAEPMAARRSDARIGHFTTSVVDYTDDLTRTPRRHFVNRWRLEKKDAAAALSEPVTPITFWLDRSIPEKYRAPITAGVLEWNKAFEKIGFKDALRVQVQPDDADFDTLDFGRASIRWMTNASPSFGAVGPSHVDPRSGEILDADIGIESLSSRNTRSLRTQILEASALQVGGAAAGPDFGAASLRGLRLASQCEHADRAAEQLSYAFDVLAAQGELDPAGPEAEKFVADYLMETTMHEVGHTLGLRHNFRASRVYTEQQLADPAFTAANGITGSVMEYPSINLAPPGTAADARGTPFNATIGPYDYWAVEYAYRPLAPAQEQAGLAAIAARSAEPLLAFGTDEDNFLGVDPESLLFDLGDDPLAFASRRLDIARDLLKRQETRELKPDQDYAVLRRSVVYALRDLARAANTLTRQIGGVRTLRDKAGSGRDPLAPVPAQRQRQALDLLAQGFLAADSLKLSPSLQRKLALDYEERSDAVFRGDSPAATDFSSTTLVLELQRGVLGALMSDAVASRLLDSESKADGEALRLSELYQRIDSAIWSELAGKGDIAAARRELQREHANRLAGLLLRPSALSRSDARSLLRVQASALLARLQAAAKRPGLSPESLAHLQDSADTLNQALTARLQRAGV